jgi:hypothetical protein
MDRRRPIDGFGSNAGVTRPSGSRHPITQNLSCTEVECPDQERYGGGRLRDGLEALPRGVWMPLLNQMDLDYLNVRVSDLCLHGARLSYTEYLLSDIPYRAANS